MHRSCVERHQAAAARRRAIGENHRMAFECLSPVAKAIAVGVKLYGPLSSGIDPAAAMTCSIGLGVGRASYWRLGQLANSTAPR